MRVRVSGFLGAEGSGSVGVSVVPFLLFEEEEVLLLLLGSATAGDEVGFVVFFLDDLPSPKTMKDVSSPLMPEALAEDLPGLFRGGCGLLGMDGGRRVSWGNFDAPRSHAAFTCRDQQCAAHLI